MMTLLIKTKRACGNENLLRKLLVSLVLGKWDGLGNARKNCSYFSKDEKFESKIYVENE